MAKWTEKREYSKTQFYPVRLKTGAVIVCKRKVGRSGAEVQGANR